MLSRKYFYIFRNYMHQDLMWNWWTEEVSNYLQDFYDDCVVGKRPKLAIEAPPQHGKLIANETLALTPYGCKQHGNLIIGDRVFHPSGWVTRVVAVHDPQPARVRVELTNGEVFYCHEHHEWTVYNRNKKKWETIETAKMLERGERSRANVAASCVEIPCRF